MAKRVMISGAIAYSVLQTVGHFCSVSLDFVSQRKFVKAKEQILHPREIILLLGLL